jgi:AI-2E family transporter
MADVSQHPSTFTQHALKWTIFLAATAIILYLCLLIVRPFLNVIAWSSVFVITCYPVHQRLVRKTGSVSLSAFVSSVMVVVAFVIPLLFLTAVAVDQFAALGASLQQMFADQTGPMAWAPLRQAYEWLSNRLGLDAAAIVAWTRQNASELTRVVAGYTLAAAQNVAGAVVSFVFVVFAMFLLFRDGDRSGVGSRLPRALPLRPNEGRRDDVAFPKDKQDRVKENFRQNDILALLGGDARSPPLPTKLFVLVAVVVRIDSRRFVATVFVGRLIRFLGEAYLAVNLGDRAVETLMRSATGTRRCPGAVQTDACGQFPIRAAPVSNPRADSEEVKVVKRQIRADFPQETALNCPQSILRYRQRHRYLANPSGASGLAGSCAEGMPARRVFSLRTGCASIPGKQDSNVRLTSPSRTRTSASFRIAQGFLASFFASRTCAAGGRRLFMIYSQVYSCQRLYIFRIRC